MVGCGPLAGKIGFWPLINRNSLIKSSRVRRSFILEPKGPPRIRTDLSKRKSEHDLTIKLPNRFLLN